MNSIINADTLLNYTVSEDGESATLVLGGSATPPLSLTFPPALVECLMLTLPEILLAMRGRRAQGESLSLAYALKKVDVSLAQDLTARILTLTTPGDLSVSFRISEEQLTEIKQRDAALAEQLRRFLQ